MGRRMKDTGIDLSNQVDLKPQGKKRRKTKKSPNTSEELTLKPKKVRSSKMNAEEKHEAESFDDMYDKKQYLPAPDDLDDYALQEWNYLMDCYKHQPSKILTSLDVPMLRLFCESYSRYMRAKDRWEGQFNGDIIGSDGDESSMINKCLKVMKTEMDQMRALADPLCLTVQGRARAGILAAKAGTQKKNEAADQLSKIFGGF